MPITCQFKPNGVIIWHSGVIDGKELIQTNKDIYAHHFEDGLLFQLAELSGVDKFNVSGKDMQQLALMDSLHKKEISNTQYACVVAPDETLFAKSRQWNLQSDADDFQTNVVRSMDEAVAWYKSKGINIGTSQRVEKD